jgi:hypothetical protein
LVILYRLREIRETFLWASRAPQQALDNLASMYLTSIKQNKTDYTQDRRGTPDPKLVVAMINSFGPLMQCLVPLFDTTLYINDVGFSTVAAYSGGAAASAAVTVALVLAPFTGPLAVGACAVAGCVTGWTSVAAVYEGIDWGRNQELNREYACNQMFHLIH